MRSEHIEDGSKNGAIAYYCECGNCTFWDIKRDIVEKIEKLHLERNKVLKEFDYALREFREKEARILGIELLNWERFKIQPKLTRDAFKYNLKKRMAEQKPISAEELEKLKLEILAEFEPELKEPNWFDRIGYGHEYRELRSF